jgi:hypothetical protein
MKNAALVWLAVRNLRRSSLAVAGGLLAYVALALPVGDTVGAFVGRPLLLFDAGLVLVFMLAWTFGYLFGGFTAILKRTNGVYERYFALPVPAWRVFLAEVAGVAVPSFLFGVAALALVFVRAGTLPGWWLAVLVPVAAVCSLGTVAMVYALALRFRNPRVPTVAWFAGVGAVTLGGRYLAGFIPGATALTVLLVVGIAGVCLGSLLSLRRLSARRVCV